MFGVEDQMFWEEASPCPPPMDETLGVGRRTCMCRWSVYLSLSSVWKEWLNVWKYGPDLTVHVSFNIVNWLLDQTIANSLSAKTELRFRFTHTVTHTHTHTHTQHAHAVLWAGPGQLVGAGICHSWGQCLLWCINLNFAVHMVLSDKLSNKIWPKKCKWG